ncbi:hypothetical protein NC653_019035 [Populus alba x Populus x berolinensis]|uniref:Uncharacterized protein n=1 Tax=Populus alba x Populus x berolinensis TaxID=444605 RepID=A0AAD6VWN3_9ROSI|nr:hypothetical protein NC653_019035 [Populus alba x Populus x berolinensis]
MKLFYGSCMWEEKMRQNRGEISVNSEAKEGGRLTLILKAAYQGADAERFATAAGMVEDEIKADGAAAEAAGLVDSPAAVHNVVVVTGVSRLEQEKRSCCEQRRKGSGRCLDVGHD